MIGGRERAKHIDSRKHFAHEAAQIGRLRLKRVPTDDQLADVFTKSLQPAQFATIIARWLSADPIKDSESWNHSDMYRDCAH